MDKAGITVSAAHNQMITSASMFQQQEGVSAAAAVAMGAAANKDADAAIAFKCQMLAQKGFQPIENVFSLKQW